MKFFDHIRSMITPSRHRVDSVNAHGRRIFSKAQKREAVAYVKQLCPNEYAWLKRASLSGEELDHDDTQRLFTPFYAALKEGGFSNDMVEANSLIYAVKRAARKEVGLSA